VVAVTSIRRKPLSWIDNGAMIGSRAGFSPALFPSASAGPRRIVARKHADEHSSVFSSPGTIREPERSE